jgi:uncharacterized membrane protein
MSKLKLAMQWLFGLAMALAGVNHFLRPDFYVKIMPLYLPWHRELVLMSGICEVALGVLLLIPKCTVVAAWGIIALLIAVFPANLHMAMNSDLYRSIPATVLWLRLPLQGVLIAWAYWFTRSSRRLRGVGDY